MRKMNVARKHFSTKLYRMLSTPVVVKSGVSAPKFCQFNPLRKCLINAQRKRYVKKKARMMRDHSVETNRYACSSLNSFATKSVLHTLTVGSSSFEPESRRAFSQSTRNISTLVYLYIMLNIFIIAAANRAI